MPMKKGMQATGLNCLHNSSLQILLCSGMCVHWDIGHKGVTSSFKHCTPSIKVIGIPFPQSFGINYVSQIIEDAPAPQQGGRADFVVISRTEYEFLSGAHQRMDRLEERFANMEAQSATQIEILKAILERVPPAAGASSSVPPGEQQ
jgi:hypothetical protein